MERLCCRRATRISSAPKQVCITVSLPNGHFEAILCNRNWFVSDLERLAEKVFQKGFLRLAGLDGQVLDSKLSLNMAGLEDRDILTAIAQAPKVAATALSFALWHCNSHMVVWGRPQFGGDCSRVQNRLECVQEVQASFCAFAAILADGSVVTWGKPEFGGDSSAVQEKLRNVQQVQAAAGAFAAIRGK